VLEARDLQDLADRLDALSGDAEFWEREKHVGPPPAAPTFDQALKDLEAAALDMPSLVATLGTSPAGRCQEGFVVWKAIGRRCIEMAREIASLAEKIQALQPAFAAPVAPAKTFKGVVDVLYSDDLPVGMREEFASVLHGIVASVVIARAEEHGKRIEPWLARGLADAFARAPERILANMRFERLPAMLSTIVGGVFEKKILADAVEQWRREAADSSHGVFLPFGVDNAEAE
jgi:hypothetical protein